MSISALPTAWLLTGNAISSIHVACKACAEGFGNSLNLQSQLGNGGGLTHLIANDTLRKRHNPNIITDTCF